MDKESQADLSVTSIPGDTDIVEYLGTLGRESVDPKAFLVENFKWSGRVDLVTGGWDRLMADLLPDPLDRAEACIQISHAWAEYPPTYMLGDREHFNALANRFHRSATAALIEAQGIQAQA